MKTFFKIIGIVFVILFAWAAYVQNNDPDASSWYIVYGLAAIVSALFAIGRLTATVAFFLCLVAMVGAYFVWPTTFEGFAIGEGDIENIERGREAGGLIVIAIVMLVFALRISFEKRLKV